MEPQELFDSFLDNTVYRGKQVDARGVHLTVAAVKAVAGRGETDFGGGEHSPAECRKIEPQKRDEGDDYGWWELEAGQYRLEFNETLRAAPAGMLLVPNERILACGCTLAATVVGEGPITTVLSVSEAGVSIKENARVALLCPMDIS